MFKHINIYIKYLRKIFTDFALLFQKSPIDMSDQNPYPLDILSY